MILVERMAEALTKFKTTIKMGFEYIIKHPIKSLLYTAASAATAILIFIVLIYLGAFGKLPTKDYLKGLKNPVTSTIYASNNEPIGYYFSQNRSNAESSQITPALKEALIATENSRFYSHGGIDYKSYGRIFVKSILMGQNAGGGSTITQQIAKNLFGREKQFFLSTPIN